jgi:allantoicase
MYFGPKENLILPGRAATMGDGWETKRRRGAGFDWIVVRLASGGTVRKIEVDTNHFKGNFPESFRLEGCAFPSRDLDFAAIRDRSDLPWKELYPKTSLQADHRHYFEMKTPMAVDYLRLSIFPDGGVSRLRAWGEPTAGARA